MWSVEVLGQHGGGLPELERGVWTHTGSCHSEACTPSLISLSSTSTSVLGAEITRLMGRHCTGQRERSRVAVMSYAFSQGDMEAGIRLLVRNLL